MQIRSTKFIHIDIITSIIQTIVTYRAKRGSTVSPQSERKIPFILDADFADFI